MCERQKKGTAAAAAPADFHCFHFYAVAHCANCSGQIFPWYRVSVDPACGGRWRGRRGPWSGDSESCYLWPIRLTSFVFFVCVAFRDATLRTLCTCCKGVA